MSLAVKTKPLRRCPPFRGRCSRDSGNPVHVRHAAGAVGGEGVAVPSQDAVADAHQGGAVLLAEQRVDEGVAGRLGVGQALGGDAPRTGDVDLGDQLDYPVDGQGRELKGGGVGRRHVVQEVERVGW